MAFTPDGKTLVTAGADGLAKIWDVANGSVRADLAGHQHDVLCLAISPDGKTVATGGEDMTIRLWAMSDGASLGVLSGHSGGVAALAFAPDGKMLASGSLDATDTALGHVLAWYFTDARGTCRDGPRRGLCP